MESTLFKSLTTGIAPVQQVVYAPSDFGVAVHHFRVLDSTPAHGSSVENPDTCSQLHQSHAHHSTVLNNDSRNSGFGLLLNHTLKTLDNLKIPRTNATTYSHTTDPSCLVILSIPNEVEGWVMVDTSASDTT
ncbi:hypothetical protein RSOLAG1IB_08090 [Rhizoctonia solani AG-1 IB]|uniref:Uncharacterized protein n=1 Tax=Thanatephorus cucumeris (strain AG1-IB / isolate 7/3/14) TaxID=1108050 RepID=A0A0B7FKM9_THACB|nr:hypothetical protein RSOLAG1IB_08090 [Rhizoctonia solani AG-1 IB]